MNKYDWKYENSITRDKKYLEVNSEEKYIAGRTNKVLSNYLDTILYSNEMNMNVDWSASNGLDTFINEKLEANSVLNFEQLIKLERYLLSLSKVEQSKLIIFYFHSKLQS